MRYGEVEQIGGWVRNTRVVAAVGVGVRRGRGTGGGGGGTSRGGGPVVHLHCDTQRWETGA